jgi:hypothetical protein
VPRWAIGIGFALIVVGVVVTIASGSNSATSLIPAYVGVVLAALGVLGLTGASTRKHAMHVAAAIAAIAVLASLGSAIGRESTGWALTAQIATIVLCGAFVALAAQSFRAARAARREQPAS